MKVALHAGQLLQPIPGGIGRYVRELAEALPLVGVEVEAFGAGPRPADLPVRALGAGTAAEGSRLARPRLAWGAAALRALAPGPPPDRAGAR